MQRSETKLSTSASLYKLVLLLYPSRYLEQHGAEMLQNFLDLEQDTPASALWTLIAVDLIKSLTYQHLRMKSSRAAIFAFLLFLPFLLMVAITILDHALFSASTANGSMAAFVAAHRALAFSFIVILPAVGVLFVLFDTIADLIAEHSWNPFAARFLRDHLPGIAMFALGILILLFVPLHDALPCFIRGIFHQGVGNILPLIEVCRSA